MTEEELKGIDYLSIIDKIPAADCSYQEWSMVGNGLKTQGYSLSDFDSWSRLDSSRYNEKEVTEHWRSYKNTKVNGAYIIGLAKKRNVEISKLSSALSWKDKAEFGYRHQFNDEGVKITAEYHYYDENKRYLYTKVRIEGGNLTGKRIRYRTVDFTSQTSKNGKPEGVKDTLYRLPEMLERTKGNNHPIHVTEGEKDAETLLSLKDFSCIVTTPGGSTSWNTDFSHFFKGRKVVIWRDNDTDGEKFAERVKKDLRDIAFHIKIVNPSTLEKGDVTDYLEKEGGNAALLKAMLKGGKDESGQIISGLDGKLEFSDYAPWVGCAKDTLKIIPGMLAEAIVKNEHFIIVRNPEDDKSSFFWYEHGVYARCNRDDIKGQIGAYIPLYMQNDSTLNNVYGLISANGRDHIASLESINTDARYINFRNGLYEIKSRKLIPHTPDVISIKQYDFCYDTNKAKCPHFAKFISDLCTNQQGEVDQSIMNIIQEFMGLCVSNFDIAAQKKALFLYSPEGNTGKSTLISILKTLVGSDFTLTVDLVHLQPDSRFSLGRLPFKRLVACSDESHARIKDSSTIKKLVGGEDSIEAEEKGRQAISFKYRGGFVIAANSYPHFLDDKGNHVYKRFLSIPCMHSIKEEEKDSGLSEKIKNELQGVMLWALEGLHRFIDNGHRYTDSDAVNQACERFRTSTDPLYNYVTRFYDLTENRGDKVLWATFDDCYIKYEQDQGTDEKFILKKINIPPRMESYGIQMIQGYYSQDYRNNQMYVGIRKKDLSAYDFE